MIICAGIAFYIFTAIFGELIGTFMIFVGFVVMCASIVFVIVLAIIKQKKLREFIREEN